MYNVIIQVCVTDWTIPEYVRILWDLNLVNTYTAPCLCIYSYIYARSKTYNEYIFKRFCFILLQYCFRSSFTSSGMLTDHLAWKYMCCNVTTARFHTYRFECAPIDLWRSLSKRVIENRVRSGFFFAEHQVQKPVWLHIFMWLLYVYWRQIQ